MTLAADQVEAFRNLETQLWVTETRANRAWMDSVLSPDFIEHGRSGRIYTRDEILDAEMPATIPVELPLQSFRARLLDASTVLVTYVSVVAGEVTNRASVWHHDGDIWTLEFHQGTPVETIQRVAMSASELRSARFSTRLRGYDVAAVDALLVQLADEVEAGTPRSIAELREARFELALRGYDPEEVDSFLARARE